ncbi:MAG: hypothetical protein ACI4AQ_02910 [Lachnospiraceae bacterium]
MDKKKKKILLMVAFTAGVILIAVSAVLFIEWGKKMRDWWAPYEGDLIIFSNVESGGGFELKAERVTDFYFEFDAILETGSVSVSYYLDDELIFENTYGVGNNHYESEVYEGHTGMLTFKVKGSEDASGHYYDVVYTRETNMNFFLRQLRRFLGEDI